MIQNFNGVPVGWLCLDENLDPVALLPLPEFPSVMANAILLKAYEQKSGRSSKPWIGDVPEVFQPRGVRIEYESSEANLSEEFPAFFEGMLERVPKGGRI
jgi:hypothetical protein